MSGTNRVAVSGPGWREFRSAKKLERPNSVAARLVSTPGLMTNAASTRAWFEISHGF
jgi:hypothetical protein